MLKCQLYDSCRRFASPSHRSRSSDDWSSPSPPICSTSAAALSPPSYSIATSIAAPKTSPKPPSMSDRSRYTSEGGKSISSLLHDNNSSFSNGRRVWNSLLQCWTEEVVAEQKQLQSNNGSDWSSGGEQKMRTVRVFYVWFQSSGGDLYFTNSSGGLNGLTSLYISCSSLSSLHIKTARPYCAHTCMFSWKYVELCQCTFGFIF